MVASICLGVTLNAHEMSHRFHIESTFRIRGHVYVMTRYLSQETFRMSGSPTLGGLPLINWITQPRRLKPDGTQDSDAFLFLLKNKADESRVPVGQEVELKL